jgi:hypothetical protein
MTDCHVTIGGSGFQTLSVVANTPSKQWRIAENVDLLAFTFEEELTIPQLENSL